MLLKAFEKSSFTIIIIIFIVAPMFFFVIGAIQIRDDDDDDDDDLLRRPYNSVRSAVRHNFVSEMTYTVSSGTLNSSIPYHTTMKK